MSSDSAAGTPPADSSKSRNRRLFAAALSALAAIAVILVVGTTLSRAAPVFTVIETTDAPDAQLNGVCASTYMGLCTLRAAVQEAEHAGGAIIFLSAGIGDYRLTIPAGPEANDTLFCPAQPPAPSNCPTNRTGDLDISTFVHLNGVGADSSVIDGANINRIFDVHAGGTLWLTDVTLQNGKADFDEAAHHEHGGAIHNHGELILDRVAVINSSSTSTSHAWGGGGITNAGRGAAVERDRRQKQHRRAGRRHREQGRTADAERDDHRELRASTQRRRNLIRLDTQRPDVHGGRHRGEELPGRGLLGQPKDHLLRGQLRERQHLQISCPHGPPARASPISIPTPSARRCSTRCCRRAGPSTETCSVSTTTSAEYFVRRTATATASRAATAAPTSLSRAGRQRCSFAAREAERARAAQSRSASPSGSRRPASTRSRCARRPRTGPHGQARTSSPRASSSRSGRVSATSDSPSR